MVRKHLTYFMGRELYDAAEDAARHFRSLNKQDWLRIFNHLYAHEIECPGIGRNKGYLLGLVRDHDLTYVCQQALDLYFSENGGISSLPDNEVALGFKARRLFQKLKKFEMVDLNTGRNFGAPRWAISRQAA